MDSNVWLQPQVSLRPFCTLRTGGPAEWFAQASRVDDLAEIALQAQSSGRPMMTIGWGSNLLPSDQGVKGVVVHNAAKSITFGDDGTVVVDCGAGLQELFLKTAQRGLAGLSFAVGIPGTVGGALVSNAGAYRSNLSVFVTEIEIVAEGSRRWVDPAWMEFDYRDSKLRKPNAAPCSLLRVKMKFGAGDRKEIFDQARDFQRQRISKQPAPASAGSFFKNVNDAALAEKITEMPERIRSAGVVPAGFLLERVGMAGYRHGGAMLSKKHANFMLNVSGATATEIRQLANIARQRVHSEFGVTLEEEVLYVGEWAEFDQVR